MNSHEDKFYDINLTENALEKKIRLFADRKGCINKKSIYNICRQKLHFTRAQAEDTAENILHAAWLYPIRGVNRSFFKGMTGQFKPKDAIPLFTLLFDGGLYQKNGDINKKLFDILETKYAYEDWDGEKIISKSMMKLFLKKETHPAARFAADSEKAFELIFNKMVSRHKINAHTRKIEEFVTLRNLKLWYTNGKYILKDIQSGALPAKMLKV